MGWRYRFRTMRTPKASKPRDTKQTVAAKRKTVKCNDSKTKPNSKESSPKVAELPNDDPEPSKTGQQQTASQHTLVFTERLRNFYQEKALKRGIVNQSADPHPFINCPNRFKHQVTLMTTPKTHVPTLPVPKRPATTTNNYFELMPLKPFTNTKTRTYPVQTKTINPE
mmetsp:Transcript_43014/g.50315  ORF Transcript_43014/g.50315 Transcript_43014/m.50315 type:complete len:168 (+) Transcript_43014:484-987(+)